MPIPDRSMRGAVAVAAISAAGMIGFQTAAKATRDALFLSTYPVAAYPTMVIVAALTAVGLALLSSRLLTRIGPGRLVPVAFAASAVLLVLEWAMVPTLRRVVAVLFFLHYAGLGAILISGFWSVINERFDPRTAKRYLGRIAAGGTVGGVLGGIVAAQVAVTFSVQAMFPLLAGLHLGCAWLILLLGRSARGTSGTGALDAPSGLAVLASTPYLRALVTVVLLTTMSEALLDYVFKARASAAYGRGEDLLRLFAWFHTAIGAVAFVVQAGLARSVLQGLGLGRTVATLPASVVLGGAGALLVPGLASVMTARGIEAITRSGLYRAGFELLFAPIPATEKRASKSLVDVGVVRLGDIMGMLLVQLTLIALVAANELLLGLAVLLSIAALIVTVGLQRGYASALERNLLARAGQLDLQQAHDVATRTSLLHTAGAVGVTLTGLETLEEPPPATPEEPPPAPARPRLADAEATRYLALRSRDAARVRGALAEGPLSRALVSEAIALLAWDVVAREAMTALRPVAERSVGQLVDALLDPDEDFAVRRRLPLVLAACQSQRAVSGLVAGLQDRRFEVRYRCGRALARLRELDPSLAIDSTAVLSAVLREVAVDRGVWESQRLLDQADDEGWSPVGDELIRDRANRSLEHVFTMLALVLPRQPLRVAFRGLHTDDPHLRGTALEYLEATLPENVRQALWPFLEDHRTRPPAARPSDAVLRELLASNASIVVNLERLRRGEQSG